MPDIVVKNFKGVFERASKFDLPDVMAETCTDLLPSHEGKLVKRKGYETATLSKNTFGVTGLSGNIINIFELVTGRASTDGPDEAIKYLCQTDDSPGKLYLWNDETTTTAVWTQIDNSLTDFRDADGTVQKCRFLEEGGQVRVLAGNRSVNKPLWWGYCDQRFANAISATDGTKTPVSGGFLTAAVLSNLSKPVFSDYVALSTKAQPTGVTWTTMLSVSDPIVTATYSYKISLQYDNKQWTVPSAFDPGNDNETITSNSRNCLLITINSSTMNKRLTGIKIYRQELASLVTTTPGQLDTATSNYYLLETIYLNDDAGTFASPTTKVWPYTAAILSATFASANKRFTLVGTISNDDAIADDMLNGGILAVYQATGAGAGATKYCEIADTVFTATNNQYIDVVNDTGLVNGETYYIKVIRGWCKNSTNYKYLLIDDVSQEILKTSPDINTDLGISDESVSDVYPKYGTMVNDQIFYANCYHNKEQKHSAICYGMITNDGLFANDVLPILNVFSTQSGIKNISSIGDRLIVYGDTRIYRGIIPNSNESSWEFEKLFDEFGLLSSDSLVNINGRDYFLASDWDIKEFDGITQPKSIGAGIYDTIQTAGDSSITYLKTVVGFKMPKISMYCIRIQTGASSYQYWGYDLRNRAGWIQFSWASNFTGFFNGQNGDTYGFTATTLKKLNTGTDDDGTAITPVYKTAPLFLDKKTRIHLSQAVITYKSNTVIQIDFYLDGGSAITQVSDQLAAKTALGDGVKHLPLGSNGRYVQIGITIPSANQASNTYLEIDQLQLPVEVSGAEQ